MNAQKAPYDQISLPRDSQDSNDNSILNLPRISLRNFIRSLFIILKAETPQIKSIQTALVCRKSIAAPAA